VADITVVVRGHGIGTTVPDIVARPKGDGATAVTVAEIAVAIEVGTEAIAAAMAASRQVEAARKAAAVRRKPPGRAHSRNRSNSRRVRLTSAARTGTNRRRCKGRKVPRGTTSIGCSLMAHAAVPDRPIRDGFLSVASAHKE
jgi:hypothetical protein